MDFLNLITQIKILSVLDLSWDNNDVFVDKRPYHSISFRVLGSAEFETEEKTLRVDEGDIVFMPAGAGYRLITPENRLYAINFEMQLEDDVDLSVEAFRPSDFKSMENSFRTMLEVWNMKEPGYYLRAMSIFCKILSKIENERSSVKSSASFMKIKASVEYMHSCYTESDLSIAEVAERSGLSETYFRRLFTSVYGKKPIDYLNELRISYACELLISGFYSAKEIAFKSGYSDPKYFSTVFKRVMGVPPTEYKNNSLK